MKTATIIASVLAVAAATLAVPAAAAPNDGIGAFATELPELGRATTFRFDEAGNGFDHYPSCTGQLNGTAHHSCGSLTGGPAGGLL